MASTPEGKVKEKVKRMLKDFGDEVYSHWPVQNGMGMPTLDCIGCGWGVYFAIETKAEGKKPTPRQELTISQIQAAGGVTFIIKNELDVENCRISLELLKRANYHRK